MTAVSRPTGRNTPRPSADTTETADGRTGPRDDEWLLPTPTTLNRASRRALLGPKFGTSNRTHWTMPGLEQVLEMLQGILPKEFHSWDEVKGKYRELGPPVDDHGDGQLPC